MNFTSFPENPIPDGLARHSVVASDGVRLRAALWRPAGTTRGTVCLFQGRAETIEKYYEVVGELLSRGFAVAALDWRGQGGSDRPLKNRSKGHVDDFAEYERDLDAFMTQLVLPDCPPPYFALAHSTGGLVCLHAARRNRLLFERMVLTAPLLDLGAMNPPRWFVKFASGGLAFLGAGDAFPPGSGLARGDARGFERNPLTSDPRRFDRNLAIAKEGPELSIGPPTVSWLHAACRAMVAAEDPDFAADLKIPTLLIAAGDDKVVSPTAIERLVRTLRLGSLITIPGSKHEVLMERDPIRAQFWAAFDAFIPGSA